jgi:WhiB family redox-sensing transcriptional regulator
MDGAHGAAAIELVGRSWHARAACRGADPALFFAEQMESEAKALCCCCPVRLDCLEAGLGEPWGVWGGLTARERRGERRRRRPGAPSGARARTMTKTSTTGRGSAGRPAAGSGAQAGPSSSSGVVQLLEAVFGLAAALRGFEDRLGDFRDPNPGGLGGRG